MSKNLKAEGQETLDSIIEKYNDLVKLKFSSYYKYSFSFRGNTEDGLEIYASVGGSADDIYKFSVDANTEETLKSLLPNYISVKKDGQMLHEVYEYY
jgi:hypothetical protein